MSKVVSAGILLQHKDKFLLGHPTELSGTTNGWGILKGKVDKGETLRRTAIREFQEESGFNLDTIADIGLEQFMYPFHKYKTNAGKKTVYVFWMVDFFGEVFRTKLHCPSIIEGTDKPEIDQYRWVTADEAIKLVVESQKEMFERVRELTIIK